MILYLSYSSSVHDAYGHPFWLHAPNSLFHLWTYSLHQSNEQSCMVLLQRMILYLSYSSSVHATPFKSPGVTGAATAAKAKRYRNILYLISFFFYYDTSVK